MSDVNDYRFVRNAEAWKQRVSSEDKAMLNFIRDYRGIDLLRKQASSQPFVTKRQGYGYSSKPHGYTSHILPHLLAPDDAREMMSQRNSYYDQMNNNPPKSFNTMQPTSPTMNRSLSSSRSSARSQRSHLQSSRSNRSSYSLGQKSVGSVNMMQIDEENTRRIEDLEKVLEEERKGREQVQKELATLKNMMQGYMEHSK